MKKIFPHIDIVDEIQCWLKNNAINRIAKIDFIKEKIRQYPDIIPTLRRLIFNSQFETKITETDLELPPASPEEIRYYLDTQLPEKDDFVTGISESTSTMLKVLDHKELFKKQLDNLNSLLNTGLEDSTKKYLRSYESIPKTYISLARKDHSNIYYCPERELKEDQILQAQDKLKNILNTFNAILETYGLELYKFHGFAYRPLADRTVQNGGIPIESCIMRGGFCHSILAHLVQILAMILGKTKEEAKTLLKELIINEEDDVHLWNRKLDCSTRKGDTHPIHSPYYINSFTLYQNTILGQIFRFTFELQFNMAKMAFPEKSFQDLLNDDAQTVPNFAHYHLKDPSQFDNKAYLISPVIKGNQVEKY